METETSKLCLFVYGVTDITRAWGINIYRVYLEISVITDPPSEKS